MTMKTSKVPSLSSAGISSKFPGCMTAIFLFCAHVLTGGEATSIPRPRALSGVVTTSEGTRPAYSRLSKKTLASPGVPKKANRTLLLFFWFVIIECDCFVSIENAVEVVHFVLEHVRQKARRAAGYFLSFFVVRAEHRFLRAGDDTPFAAHREAPLVFLFFRTRYFEKRGVDVDLVRH